MNELLEFLHARKSKFQNSMNLAKMMGITFSGLLRAMKTGTMSTENCLRLAEVLGEDPPAVLRLAKKPKVAEQIERMFGKRTRTLSAEDRELLEDWERLSPKQRQIFRSLISDLLPQKKRARTA
ncbi:MAG TPA: hypothetical protein VEU08_17250 [Vicinamibacterales bacterium]|nr:hypothetical protein [Vicinamibacterales bacterium]